MTIQSSGSSGSHRSRFPFRPYSALRTRWSRFTGFTLRSRWPIQSIDSSVALEPADAADFSQSVTNRWQSLSVREVRVRQLPTQIDASHRYVFD